jgi:hypothetical protein
METEKRFVVFSCALLAFALVASAAYEPWRSKPYQQWDQKDINKILTDSPWSKLVQVNAPWLSNQSQQPSVNNPPAATAPLPGQTQPSSRGQQPAATPQPTVSGSAPQPGQMAQDNFVIRWYSAETVREAVIRDAQMKGQLSEADASKLLAQRPNDYEVLVAGPDMSPFASANADALRGQAALVIKKTKAKLQPAKVEIQRTPDSKVAGVIFSFPRKNAQGQPFIDPSDRNVEFVFDAGALKLRSTFDVPKMTNQQGPDL